MVVCICSCKFVCKRQPMPSRRRGAACPPASRHALCHTNPSPPPSSKAGPMCFFSTKACPNKVKQQNGRSLCSNSLHEGGSLLFQIKENFHSRAKRERERESISTKLNAHTHTHLTFAENTTPPPSLSVVVGRHYCFFLDQLRKK